MVKAALATGLALLVAALAARSGSGVTITSCWDGDTCRAGDERIRLACIDTPERGRPGAAAATRRTRQLLVGRRVTIRRITTDRYGRTVAELIVPQGNVAQLLVQEGHARVLDRYAHQCDWAR